MQHDQRIDSEQYPSPSYVRSLFDVYKVPINIRRHCEAVARTSVILAKKLYGVGIDVDIGFTESLALVHDLFKHAVLPELKADQRFGAPKPTQEEIDMHKQLRARFPHMKETRIAHEIFKKEYPTFAVSVLNEGYAAEQKTWEEKIVKYVDYITFSDRIIGLEARLQDVEERYHADDPEHDMVWQCEKERLRDIERQLFTLIGQNEFILRSLLR